METRRRPWRHDRAVDLEMTELMHARVSSFSFPRAGVVFPRGMASNGRVACLSVTRPAGKDDFH